MMPEIKNELKEIIGMKGHNNYKKRVMSIIEDKKQLSVRIPTQFVELSGLNKNKHVFEFTLVPIENEKYKIEVEIKPKG